MTNDAWTCRTRDFLGMVAFLVGSVLLSVGMADAQDRTIADDDWCDGHEECSRFEDDDHCF